LIVILLVVCASSAALAFAFPDSGPYGPQFWIILFGGIAAVVLWFIQRRRGKP
jgi:hypothetical protein